MLLMDHGENGSLLVNYIVTDHGGQNGSVPFGENNTADNDALVNDMNRIGHGIVIPMIATIGMILNVLNLLVLCNGKLAESSYTYLTGLAFADFGSLSVFFINGIGRGNFPSEYEWRIFEAYIYFPCGLITTTAGAMLTVTVSVERFIFIYKPTKAQRYCQQRIARKITAILGLISFVINVPRFFVFTVNQEQGKLEYTEFGKSILYNILSWFYFVTVSCGCGIALIVFNIILMRGVHKTNIRKRTMCGTSAKVISQQRQDELRLTRTLISVVTVYLIGEIPSALVSRTMVVALIGHGDPSILQTKPYKVFSLVATILVVAQLSLNFVVYCVFNKRFWATFKKQLCPCCRTDTPTHTNGHIPLTNHMDHDHNSTSTMGLHNNVWHNDHNH